MDRKLLESALSSFLRAWETKDVDAVIDILSDTFAYYETPFDAPLTDKDQVRALWAPVPTFEADITLSFETLAVRRDFGLFRISGTYTHHGQKAGTVTKIDRVFLIAADANGMLTKFMQWRESKDL